jgi:hypothetical protein
MNIPCGFSDFHNMVSCTTKCAMPQALPHKIAYRSYKRFN